MRKVGELISPTRRRMLPPECRSELLHDEKIVAADCEGREVFR